MHIVFHSRSCSIQSVHLSVDLSAASTHFTVLQKHCILPVQHQQAGLGVGCQEHTALDEFVLFCLFWHGAEFEDDL